MLHEHLPLVVAPRDDTGSARFDVISKRIDRVPDTARPPAFGLCRRGEVRIEDLLGESPVGRQNAQNHRSFLGSALEVDIEGGPRLRERQHAAVRRRYAAIRRLYGHALCFGSTAERLKVLLYRPMINTLGLANRR
jgi:hypothetical protein